MPMGFNHFFRLSSREYKAYLKAKTDQELKTQELKRIRGEIANCYAIGVGIGSAVATGGAALLMAGVALRKKELCRRKYEMIQEELASRNIPLHEFNWKDFAIPAGTGMIGTVVGFGVDVGLNHAIQIQPPAVDVGTAAAHAFVPISTADQALGVSGHLGDASAGFAHGFLAEPRVLAHRLSDHVAMNFDISEEYYATAQSVYVHGTVAQTAGFASGAQAAESAEKAIASLVALSTSTSLAETIETRDPWMKMESEVGCRRCLQYPYSGIWCDSCGTPIEEGYYMRKYRLSQPAQSHRVSG